MLALIGLKSLKDQRKIHRNQIDEKEIKQMVGYIISRFDNRFDKRKSLERRWEIANKTSYKWHLSVG